MTHPTFVLIHSPLVGPLTWSLVAVDLRDRGYNVLVPELIDDDRETTPLWRQHTDSVIRAIRATNPTRPMVLVAHSGAGALLPAIGHALDVNVAGYCFVDAVIPIDGLTRLDLLETESAEFAREFRQHLTGGGHFPEWKADDLAPILPDPAIRRQMIAELRPRSLPFFTEPIPVSPAWPDAPCAYLQFIASYATYANRARNAGWNLRTIDGGHFHMLVDPVAVAETLIALTEPGAAPGSAPPPTSDI